MAGKKDKTVVAVISGLTDAQAAQISSDILKAKQRHAPAGRGTIATGKRENVGRLIQKGNAKAIEMDNAKQISQRKSRNIK